MEMLITAVPRCPIWSPVNLLYGPPPLRTWLKPSPHLRGEASETFRKLSKRLGKAETAKLQSASEGLTAKLQ